MMQKTMVQCAIILGLALFLSSLVWANYSRFQIVRAQGALAYVLDQRTGRVWAVAGTSMIRIKKGGPDFLDRFTP